VIWGKGKAARVSAQVPVFAWPYFSTISSSQASAADQLVADALSASCPLEVSQVLGSGFRTPQRARTGKNVAPLSQRHSQRSPWITPSQTAIEEITRRRRVPALNE